MPRRRIEPEQPLPSQHALAEKLRDELKSNREAGQPLVYEQELRPDTFRVLVIWDEWDRLLLDERTGIILRAYELAEGTAYRNKIALASGLTFPEATASGMLPYQIGTALRKSDPVTFAECADALRAEGASTLFGPGILQLRFATREEAEACRQRLIRRLPKSENVWVINRELSVQDIGAAEESAGVISS